MSIRRLTLILLIPALLATGIASGLAWLTGSESGARWLLSRLEAAVSGEFKVTVIEGDLTSGLVLEGIAFRDDSIEVSVERLELMVDLDLIPPALQIPVLAATSPRVRQFQLQSGGEAASWQDALGSLSMPFPLELENLKVSDIKYIGSDGEMQFSAASLEAAARLEDELDVERLTLVSQGTSWDVTTRLGLAAPFRLKAVAKLEFDASVHPDLGPVAIDLQGALSDSLSLELASSAPDFTLAGEIRRPLDEADWDLELTSSGFQWPQGTKEAEMIVHDLNLRSSGRLTAYTLAAKGAVFLPEFEALSFKLDGDGDSGGIDVASLSVAGEKLELVAGGRLSWQKGPAMIWQTRLKRFDPGAWLPDWPAGQTLNGELDLALDEDSLNLNRVILRAGETPIRLEASAIVDLSEGVVDAKLAWNEASWPIADPAPMIYSQEGNIRLAGTPDDWHIAAETDLASGSLPPGQLQLEGAGNRDGASIQIIEGRILGGIITGEAEYSWADQGRWQASLDTRRLDIGSLLKDWPGTINAVLLAEGQGEPFQLQLNIERLDGMVRNRPTEARGLILADGNDWAFSDFTARSGESTLELNGDPYDTAGLQFSVDIVELNDILPGASGKFITKGAISLPGENPWVRLEFDGENLAWEDLAVRQLVIRSDDTAVPPGIANFNLEASQLLIGDRSLDNLTVDLVADPGAQTLGLAIKKDGATLSTSLAGSLDDWKNPLGSVWKGRLESLQLTDDRGLSLSLEDAAGLMLSANSASISGACIVGKEDAQLCLEAEWSESGTISTEAELRQIPANLVNFFVDNDLEFTQKMNGKLRWDAVMEGKPSGNARIAVSPGEISYIDDEDSVLTTEAGIIGFELDSGRLSAGNFDIPLPGSRGIDLDFSLPDVSLGLDAGIEGRARINLDDLGFITLVAPLVDEARGRIEVDLALSGTLGDPHVSGSISLADGEIEHHSSGLMLSDIQLSGQINAIDQAELQGSFMAVEGAGQLFANADLSDVLAPRFELTLKGDKLVFFDVPDLTVVADPDISLAWQDGVAEVNGSLFIPSARISPSHIPATSLTESPDLAIIAGELPETRAGDSKREPIDIRGNFEVALGDDVRLDLGVATAELGGSAIFSWQDELIPVANGSYSLVGQIQAFGQLLEVTRGNIGFPRIPADNPHLNIRAERQIFGNSDISKAGVFVTGTLRRPVIEPFTEPMTNRDRARTLLVTGSDFNYEQGVGAIDVGTYIAPRLFVAYGIGVFEEENVISIRYDLGRNFGIKATSGQRETGVDLNYRIER
jgi:translocation and assembly module TamB